MDLQVTSLTRQVVARTVEITKYVNTTWKTVENYNNEHDLVSCSRLEEFIALARSENRMIIVSMQFSPKTFKTKSSTGLDFFCIQTKTKR